MNNNLQKTLCNGMLYGLKFESSLDQIENAPPIYRKWTARGIDVLFADWCVTTVENSDAYPIQTVKPYLFSLTDITKEIEFRGERFVPIDRIAEIVEDVWFNEDFTREQFWYEIVNGILKLSLEKSKRLNEWLVKHHFNVFGLEEDQFIRVTEENNPYK